MRYVLTGSSGNLGKHLGACFKNELLPVGREDWDKLPCGLEQGMTFIHLAYDLKKSISMQPTAIIESNLLSTSKLLELAKTNNAKQFIFISSCAVYGNSIDTREDQFCAPLSTNGVFKLLNEKIVQEFCKKNGISFKVIRVFNLYGGDDNFSIFYHIKNALNNRREFIVNNAGVSQRDFIHVRDVAAIIHAIVESNSTEACINVGTGIATRIGDIVRAVKAKYPDLRVIEKTNFEAEYSRAHTDKLHKIVNHPCIDVFDYIRTEF